MISSIITGSPLWIWPLLAFLVWYGLRASRTRTTTAIAVYLLPLLGLISVNAVLKMPHQGIVWTAYAAAYLIGIAAGAALQRRWLLQKNGLQVTLAGEWFSMAVLMTIFWMNFAGGVFRVLLPDLYANTAFLAAFAMVVGTASGTFSGRALRVWLWDARPAPSLQVGLQ